MLKQSAFCWMRLLKNRNLGCKNHENPSKVAQLLYKEFEYTEFKNKYTC